VGFKPGQPLFDGIFERCLARASAALGDVNPVMGEAVKDIGKK